MEKSVSVLKTKQWEKYERLLKAKEQDLSEALRTRDPISFQRTPEPEEEAQRTAEQDLAVLDLNRAVEMLRQTQDALARIEDGSYGFCLSCEQEINPRRLTAVPWAAYCLGCQETLDQQQARRRERKRDLAEAAPLRRRAA